MKADDVSLDSRLRGNERRKRARRESAAAACVENGETLPEQRHAVKDYFPNSVVDATRP